MTGARWGLFALVAATGTVSAAAPKTSDLPSVALPGLPDTAKKPASIPADSQVPGVRIAGPGGTPLAPQTKTGKRRFVPAPGSSIEVSTDAPEASCVSVSLLGRDAFRANSMFLDRSEGVSPIRIETLREDGAGATLAIHDIWVDTVTLGVASNKKTEIPLARVATGPLGSSAYAFRDAATVQLVIPSGNNGQVQTGDGQFISASCATLRAELKSERGKAAVLSGFFMKQTPAVEAREGEPAIPPVAIRLGLSASLSQTSRDVDPVLSVVMRALDEIPTPQKRRP